MPDQFYPPPQSEPTVPHQPEDEYAARTQRGSLPPLPPGASYAQPGPSVPAPTPPAGHNPYSYDGSYTGRPPGGSRERVRRRRVHRRRTGSEWTWVLVAAALFGVTLVVSMSVFIILRSSRGEEAASSNGLAAVDATAVVIVPTAVQDPAMFSAGGGPGNEPQANPEGVIIEPWNGQERFTVLLMGWDRRPGDSANGAYRTDTMMLISLDPETDSVGILSIPRDLYVNIPGYSQLQRVNSAYVYGELQRAGYGPELAMQTVQLNLGIRVNDYVIVDFNSFITVVDAIGGIDVDVPTTINDPLYPDMHYGYDPFYLAAGRQHLDGETALKYARTRHGNSDFDRATRQQQVIMAIRDRILNLENLPQLVANAATIWGGIQDGVKTGLSFDQILQLAWYAKDIPASNIHTGVIDEDYITFYTTPRGEAVVIPNRYTLGSLMMQVFGPNYGE